MRRLDSLTSLRFLAAFYVFAEHGASLLLPSAISDLTVVGYSGVGFFFVLSGFVLAWSSDGAPARTFYRRRFARVYPLHLLTLVVAVAAGFGGDSIPGLIAAVLLVQAWVPTSAFVGAGNGVSWSLSCEAFFYAVMPRLRFGGSPWRSVWTALGVTAAVTLGLHLAWGAWFADPIVFFNPAFRLGEFVAGAALGTAMRQGWRPPLGAAASSVLVVGALTAFTVAFLATGAPLPRDVTDLALAVPFAMLICSAAALDAQRSPSMLRRRWLIRLGEWSFAFYLIHSLVLLSLPEGGGWDWFALAIGLSVALSAAAHLLVERPLERRLRGRTLRPERPSREPVGSTPG